MNGRSRPGQTTACFEGCRRRRFRISSGFGPNHFSSQGRFVSASRSRQVDDPILARLARTIPSLLPESDKYAAGLCRWEGSHDLDKAAVSSDSVESRRRVGRWLRVSGRHSPSQPGSDHLRYRRPAFDSGSSGGLSWTQRDGRCPLTGAAPRAGSRARRRSAADTPSMSQIL